MRLNSSSSRHACAHGLGCVLGAARAAPAAASARSSSSRSACDDRVPPRPTATTTRSRYHAPRSSSEASSSARSAPNSRAPDALVRLARRQVEARRRAPARARALPRRAPARDVEERPRPRRPGSNASLAVGGARRVEQRALRARGLRVEQPRGAVEPRRPRHARGRRRCSVVELGRPGVAIQLSTARSRQPPERHELAAGADRLRERAELVGDEDERRVRRRLLEILEQRVGGVVVQPVRVEDRGTRGDRPRTAACGGRGAARGSRRSGSSRRAPRSPVQVGVRAASTRRASPSSAPRTRAPAARLPTPGGPVEEVRVRGPFGERGLEQALCLVLLGDVGEGRHRALHVSGRRASPSMHCTAYTRGAEIARATTRTVRCHGPRVRARPARARGLRRRGRASRPFLVTRCGDRARAARTRCPPSRDRGSVP